MSSTFYSLASAFAQAENSQYPNNPGGILDSSGKPVDYGSMQAGYDALEGQLEYDASGQSTIYNPGMSLEDYATTYTGGNTNEGNTVAQIMGVSPSTPLNQLSDSSIWGTNNPQDDYTLPDANFASMEPSPVTVNPNGTITQTTPTGTTTAPAGQSSWLTTLLSVFGNIGNIESDIVGVLLGLILIAGAVFTFSQVKDTVIAVGRKAVEAGVAA